MRPAEVSFLKPLKQNWKDLVTEWKRKNRYQIAIKLTFLILLQNAIINVSESIVQNGLRKCKIFPFNAEAIDYTKCTNDSYRVSDTEKIKVKLCEFSTSHLLYLESTMMAEREMSMEKTSASGC